MDTVHFVATSRKPSFPYSPLYHSSWPRLQASVETALAALPARSIQLSLQYLLDCSYSLKRQLPCLSQFFSSTFGPAATGHDLILQISVQVSVLASWIVSFDNFSSVQIGIEHNIFASYLHGYAALGPARVLRDTRR